MREDALQKGEADLLAQVTASYSVAAELQQRERAIWALNLNFTGRASFTSGNERMPC